MRKPALLLAILILLLGFCLIPHGPHPVSRSFGQAAIGGAFELTDTHGHTVRDSDFRGRLMLVYFGYSHCPDLCPTTLDTIGKALDDLGADSKQIAAIFITLDPARDTPQALAAYLKSFDPRIIGLTGSKGQVMRAAAAYRTYSKKSAAMPDRQNYLVDHSGILYLMDTQGRYITHFDAGATPKIIVRTIRETRSN